MSRGSAICASIIVREYNQRMVLAAVDDLLFRSKIRTVAKQVGADVQFVKTAAEVREAIAAAPSLAVLDLHAAAIDPVGSIAQLRANGVPVIGFYAHVHTDVAQAAIAAGATQVMPRSAFATRLPEILAAERADDSR
jgi:CheY-like chemotaxis protein